MDVERILRECGALLSGHFLLSSGNHSPQYFQCARLMQYPDRTAEVFSVIAGNLRRAQRNGLRFDMAVGPAIGGITASYELGRQLGIPALFTERNDAGEMTLRRGFEIPAGSRVIIAEDVITTGKSTLEAARCVEALGGIVVASACVVDRRPDCAENPFRWQIFPALRQSALIYAPAECPLCRDGKLPALKPGSRPAKQG
jgi:orotate phosphoribosyltransferase